MLLLGLIVGALVTGCSGRTSRSPTGTIAGAQAEWFCQMGPGGDDWECVRDDRLSREPKPERVPGPAAPVAPPAPARPRAVEEPPTPPGPAFPEADGAPAADRRQPAPPRAAVSDPAAPDYVKLAYRPPQPLALTELPGEFYAVQLVAMSSKPALERYVEQEGISGISAARVERNGELFYVLILGIYETAGDARRAVASLPDELAASAPWIRPLGSLQAAMQRADDLAGSARF